MITVMTDSEDAGGLGDVHHESTYASPPFREYLGDFCELCVSKLVVYDGQDATSSCRGDRIQVIGDQDKKQCMRFLCLVWL